MNVLILSFRLDRPLGVEVDVHEMRVVGCAHAHPPRVVRHLLQVNEDALRDHFIERTVAVATDLDRADVLAWQESVLITSRVDELTGSRDAAKVRRNSFGVPDDGV